VSNYTVSASVSKHTGKPFEAGQRNPKWTGGRPLNTKGYVRLKTRENRYKYEHRVVMERLLQEPLCAEYVFPERGKIPEKMTVEHLDHVRTHNCHQNLMLLEKCIHDSISLAYRAYILANYEAYLVWVAEENKYD